MVQSMWLGRRGTSMVASIALAKWVVVDVNMNRDWGQFDRCLLEPIGVLT